MKLLKNRKFKLFANDLFLNTFAFGIVTISQQIIAFPLLSRYVSKQVFAECVIMISMMNVLSAIFGSSIGNTRIITNKNYSEIKNKGDFKYILVYSSISTYLISLLLYYFFAENKSLINLILFPILSVFSSFKFYLVAEYRLKKYFKKILIQSFIYMTGVLVGIGFFFISKEWVTVFVVAELFSLLYLIKNSLIINESMQISSLFKSTLISWFHISYNIGLKTALSYFDRFLIFPILGAEPLGVYFAASVVARMGALITNPASHVILTWLANVKEKNKTAVFNYTIIFSIVISIVYFVLVVIASPFVINLLYPQYYEKSLDIVILICIGNAFGIGSSINKPVLMSCGVLKLVSYMNSVYSILLLFFGIFFSNKYGLIGFAFALLLVQFFLWSLEITYVIYLRNKSKNTKII